MVEVYPRRWRGDFPTEGRSGDQHDAYRVALWLQQADQSGALRVAMRPTLTSDEAAAARIEGWILAAAKC